MGRRLLIVLLALLLIPSAHAICVGASYGDPCSPECEELCPDVTQCWPLGPGPDNGCLESEECIDDGSQDCGVCDPVRKTHCEPVCVPSTETHTNEGTTWTAPDDVTGSPRVKNARCDEAKIQNPEPGHTYVSFIDTSYFPCGPFEQCLELNPDDCPQPKECRESEFFRVRDETTGQLVAGSSCGYGGICSGGGTSCRDDSTETVSARWTWEESVCGGSSEPDPICGDGQVNQPWEECDDGNEYLPGDGCDGACRKEVCGNGDRAYSDPDRDGEYTLEECDDGNLINGDGCESDCTFTPPCESIELPEPTSDDYCADGSLPYVARDAGYAARLQETEQAYDDYLANYVQKLTHTDSYISLRFPAALFRFTEGNAPRGNELLAKQLQFTTSENMWPNDALYLAWMYHKHRTEGIGMSEANAQEAHDLLTAYTVPFYGEDDLFIDSTIRYLREHTEGDLTCEATRNVYQSLQAHGEHGWSTELSPGALQNVVVALAALADDAPNASITQLATMNLDVIFAYYATKTADGTWGGARADDTIRSSAYGPANAPWYGWGYLLFGQPTDPYNPAVPRVRDPSVLITEYVPPAAVRAVLSARTGALDGANAGAGGGREIETKESFSGREGYAYTYANSDYVFGGTVDAGDVLEMQEGYTTRLTLRRTDDAASLIRVSSYVANTSYPFSDLGSDTGQVYTERGFAFGDIGQGTCHEPHVFVSPSNQAYLFGSTEPQSYLRVVCLPAKESASGTVCTDSPSDESVWVALRFLETAVDERLDERYYKLGEQFPNHYYDQQTDKGTVVLIPDETSESRGIFALEVLPEQFLNRVRQGCVNCGTWFNIDLFYELVDDVHFTRSGNTITYSSNVSGRRIEYEYDLAGNTVKKDDVVVRPDGYAPRNAQRPGGGVPFIEYKDGAWAIHGEHWTAPQSFFMEHLYLDFDADTYAAMKRTDPAENYGCAPSSSSGETEEPAPPIDEQERIAWLAASLLEERDTSPGRTGYTLQCGPLNKVFPNAAPLATMPVPPSSGCVLHDSDRGERTVGVLFTPGDPDGPAAILRALESGYYPYHIDSSPRQPIDTTMCDAVMNDASLATTLAFQRCDDSAFELFTRAASPYHSMSARVSRAAGILVLSSDLNPFTTGFMSDWYDFFRELLGLDSDPGANPELAGRFSHGFYYSSGETLSGADGPKTIRAQMRALSGDGGDAELLFLNFGSPIDPLLDRLPETVVVAERLNGDHDGEPGQYARLQGLTDQSWRTLTTALRVDPTYTGTPDEFFAHCGNGVLDLGEECDEGDPDDPNSDGSGVIGDCRIQESGVEQEYCNPDCTKDLSECGEKCIDRDNDGYLSPREGVSVAHCENLHGTLDCYDEPPKSVLVQNIYPNASNDCQYDPPTPINCSTVYDTAGSGSCLVKPTTKCPQCVSPGTSSDFCNDGVDGDCDGNDDLAEGCPEQEQCTPPGAGGSSATCPTPNPTCLYICGGLSDTDNDGVYDQHENNYYKSDPVDADSAIGMRAGDACEVVGSADDGKRDGREHAIRSDCNSDGSVDGDDQLWIQQATGSAVETGEEWYAKCDINSDGIVNDNDLGLWDLYDGRAYCDVVGSGSSCAICGDGCVGGTEECDNGGANGGCPSSCSATCQWNTCGGGSSGCFLAGTRVLTPTATIPIEELTGGTMLLSFDEESGEQVVAPVVHQAVFTRDHYYLINGALRVTQEHKVAVEESEGIVWREVRDLRVGDSLIADNGERLSIEELRRVPLAEPVTVYSPELAYPNTYYVLVGDTPVLVHNKAPPRETPDP